MRNQGIDNIARKRPSIRMTALSVKKVLTELTIVAFF
jgi:hypothetical protein